MLRKKSLNCGSAIIEMTFLIPVLLGIIYFYIMFFLFLMESAKYKEWIVEFLYSVQEDSSTDTEGKVGERRLPMSKQGTMISVYIDEKAELFDIRLEMHRKEDSAVENIRRWQLATDMLRTGENE